jgi:hypothetical protein
MQIHKIMKWMQIWNGHTDLHSEMATHHGRKIEAEAIAKAQKDKIARLQAELEKMRAFHKHANAHNAMCMDPAPQVSTERPEDPGSPQPCAQCPDITQGYINIPQNRSGNVTTLLTSKCKHKFCEAKGSPLPLEAYDPIQMSWASLRAASTVKTELTMSKGRFKLARDTINASSWTVWGGNKGSDRQECDNELVVKMFYDSVEEEGVVVVNLLKPTAQDLINLKQQSIGKKVTEYAYTWFLMMAPNKHKLAIEVNFTGTQILGNKIPNRILEILQDQNTIKLMAENVPHILHQLQISHPSPLCRSWVDVGNAQIIAAPTWDQKVPPRDLFAMAKTLKYKHLFPTNEINRIHSEEAYTLGDFELFSPRMKAYLEYSLVIPFALMYKVVIRSMELAGLPDKVDANQPLQWFCDLLKGKKRLCKK